MSLNQAEVDELVFSTLDALRDRTVSSPTRRKNGLPSSKKALDAGSISSSGTSKNSSKTRDKDPEGYYKKLEEWGRVYAETKKKVLGQEIAQELEQQFWAAQMEPIMAIKSSPKDGVAGPSGPRGTIGPPGPAGIVRWVNPYMAYDPYDAFNSFMYGARGSLPSSGYLAKPNVKNRLDHYLDPDGFIYWYLGFEKEVKLIGRTSVDGKHELIFEADTPIRNREKSRRLRIITEGWIVVQEEKEKQI